MGLQTSHASSKQRVQPLLKAKEDKTDNNNNNNALEPSVILRPLRISDPYDSWMVSNIAD